jgi:hypothetical protein
MDDEHGGEACPPLGGQQNSIDAEFMMSMGPIAKCFFVCMPFVVISLISLAAVTESTETHQRIIAEAQLTPSPANQVSFQTIEKGFRSGVRQPLQIIIRGQAEWKDFWQQHASIKTNSLPAPAIDFNKEIAVGVFLGEKPTGGYEVEIVRAERSGRTLLISFVENTPRPGATVTQAITQPFHIVRVTIDGTGAVGFRRVS